MDAVCRDTQEPVEMLLRCNGEREPSWSTEDIVAIRQLHGAIRLIGGGTARIEAGAGLIIHHGCD